MTMLSLHFQDGFQGETVIVEINGDEIFHETDVRTKLLLGYASIIDIPIEQNSVDITIKVLEKQISESIQLTIAAPTYLGVSLEDDKINYFVSEQPFGYG